MKKKDCFQKLLFFCSTKLIFPPYKIHKIITITNIIYLFIYLFIIYIVGM